jgi:hypothetical protein
MPEELELVLPLRLSDLQRFEILAFSLEQCFPSRGRCWLVAPDAEVDELATRVPSTGFTVMAETTLVPELRHFRKTTGWYRQQIIKLAIAERVESAFYMTLDADVICTRRVDAGDLVRDGRAMVNVTSEDYHPDWYDWAERVLGLRRSGISHGVTPCIYGRDAMRDLHRHLSSRQAGRRPLLGRSRQGWRAYLLRQLPWTEQSLYFTFLEATGTFDRYHVTPAEDAIYDGHKSLWYKEQLASWDPDEALATTGDAYFIVAQSTTGISTDVLWSAVRRALV